MPLCGRNNPDSIPPNGVFHQRLKFVSLFFGDGRPQILHLDRALAYENDLGDFIDAGHP